VIFDGFLWWLMLILGLLMAVALVGLVGWPLMSATISTEGTDSWEAVSRSYSYVFQAPWHYLWYAVVAVAYGAVLVFFVGFMGSMTVYLSKWGVSQTPLVSVANREPSFLFVYAPKSFEWRTLMLKGVVLDDGSQVVDPQTGKINEEAYEKYMGRGKKADGTPYEGSDTLTFVNKIGAFLVGIWVFLLFLLILGFGYSYFWSASAIIYFLMRKKVDDAEIDEVYLEEDDADSYAGPLATTPPPAPAAGPRAPSLPMVDAPALRPSSAPVTQLGMPPPAEAPKPAEPAATPPPEAPKPPEGTPPPTT
jgi:hypothetical protein